MANAPQKPENLRQFDAYVDENGQNMSDDPLDVARPADLQARLNRDVGAEAEIARLASRRSSNDVANATEDVEAEVPAENIRHISDPSLGSSGGPQSGGAQEAIDRATSSLGEPE